MSIIYNGPPTEGQTYFQDSIGVYTDAYLIGMKDSDIPNREVGLYLAALINASILNEKKRKYSRGHKATPGGRVEYDKIIVPVNAKGKVDFVYMKRYIRAIEKLSIAELAKYKNSVVVATRRVVIAWAIQRPVVTCVVTC